MPNMSLQTRESGATPVRPRHCSPDESARNTHWGSAPREGAEEKEGKSGYRVRKREGDYVCVGELLCRSPAL